MRPDTSEEGALPMGAAPAARYAGVGDEGCPVSFEIPLQFSEANLGEGERDEEQRYCRKTFAPKTFSSVPEGQGSMLMLTEGNSLRGTVFNLVNSMVGGGVLSLPFAMAQCGVVSGLGCLVFVALASDLTVWMLIFCVDATRERSYARVAEMLYGRWLGIFVDLIVFLNNFGTCIAYVVIIGDLVPSFMAFANAPPYFQDRRLVLSSAALPLLCMSSLKSLGALRHVSLLCLCMIFLFLWVLVSMGSGYIDVTEPTDTPARVFELAAPQTVLKQLPVLFFAYTCHQNVPILYGELRRQKTTAVDSRFETKRAKMMTAMHTSVFFCAVAYCCAGVGGYLAFRDRTDHDVLVNFEFRTFSAAPYVKLCYAVVIFCSYPIMAFSCVASFHRLVWYVRFAVGDCCARGRSRRPGPGVEPLIAPASPASPLWSPQGSAASPVWSPRSPIWSPAAAGMQRRKHSSAELFASPYELPGETHLQEKALYQPSERKRVPHPSRPVHLMEVTFVVLLTVVVAILVPDISVVFGLTGGICCSTIVYVFPSMMFVKVKRDEARKRAEDNGDDLERRPGAFIGTCVGYAVLAFGLAVGFSSTVLIVHQTFFE